MTKEAKGISWQSETGRKRPQKGGTDEQTVHSQSSRTYLGDLDKDGHFLGELLSFDLNVVDGRVLRVRGGRARRVGWW